MGWRVLERAALSGRELSVPIELALVSKSDLDGRFMEISPDLERLSGYDADTLIGEYDEVLLHPDVPRVVLEDMRRDLGADRPWCGILKFRCRGGDHYWARVDVAPIRERGSCVGFVSIFRRAMRHQIDRAEEAYRNLRERRADGLAVRHGGVMAKGAIARNVRRYADIPARFKLMAGMLLAAVSGIVLGGVAVRLADASSDGLAVAGAAGAAGVLGLILGGVTCVTTVMDTNRRLRDAQRVMEALAAGDYLSHIEYVRDDEAGRLQQNLKILQTRLAADFMGRENSGSLAAAKGREAASEAAVRGAMSAMRSDVAALAAREGRDVEAIDQALEMICSVRDDLDDDGNRGDATIGVASEQSWHRLELGVAGLAGSIDRIRAALGRGDDAANRLELLAFRTRLLAFNAAIEQARRSQGAPPPLLAEGLDVVRGVSVSVSDIRALLADSADGVHSGAALLGEIEEQLQTLVRRRHERSASPADAGRSLSGAAAVLDRLAAGLQQIGAALRKRSEVTERLLANLAELERAADSAEGGATPAGAVGSSGHEEENRHASLRSGRRTATISPLRPVRHEVGTPVPKIGRAGASKGVPDDGWEEFHE